MIDVSVVSRLALCACLLSIACAREGEAPPQQKATLRRIEGTTFELVPGPGQLPYCLAFTHSKNGVTRQLTMSASNTSFECKPGQRVGNRTYRVPVEEGPVTLYLLFSSEPVNAASVAQQLLDQKDLATLSVMNLRLPGRASLETIEFAPQADTAPEEGQVLNPKDAGP